MNKEVKKVKKEEIRSVKIPSLIIFLIKILRKKKKIKLK